MQFEHVFLQRQYALRQECCHLHRMPFIEVRVCILRLIFSQGSFSELPHTAEVHPCCRAANHAALGMLAVAQARTSADKLKQVSSSVLPPRPLLHAAC